MRTKLVEVTAEDISDGIPDMTYGCPVALALRRTFHVSASYVSVAPWRIKVSQIVDGTDSDVVNTKPSQSVKRFVKAYDEGKPVAPFRFRVALK